MSDPLLPRLLACLAALAFGFFVSSAAPDVMARKPAAAAPEPAASAAEADEDDAADDDDAETRNQALTAEETQRLQAVMAQPRPAKRRELKRLYEAQVAAMRRLRYTPARAEAFFRSWEEAIPGDPRPTWERAQELMRNGDRDAAYAAAERAIATARRAHQRVHYRAQFASHVAADGDFDRAQALLAQAEAIAARELDSDGNSERDRWMQRRARNRLLNARCELDGTLMRHDSAVRACRQSAQVAGELAADRASLSPRDLWNAQSEHINRQLHLVQTLTAAGLLLEADRAWQQAGRIAEAYGRKRTAALLLAGAQLRLHQNRLPEAVDAARQALDSASRAEQRVATVEQVDAWRITVTARVLQGRWGDAQAALDELDRAVAGQAALARRAEMLPARTLVALNQGRAAVLLPPLRRTLAAQARRAGEDSFVTAHHRALLALVLMAGPADSVAEGRGELRRALPVLLAPPSVGDDGDEHGLWSRVREAAQRRFLDDLGDAPAEAEASLGLQVADHLLGSGVQAALTQAAARGAATTPELADIVRRDQDARNELQTLYQFIGRLSSDETPGRLDGVLSQMKRRIAELERQRSTLHAEIARQFPEYDRLVRPRPPGGAEIARWLAGDERFVMLMPTGDYVHAWSVSRSGTRYHRARLGAADLAALVQRVRATLDVVSLGRRMPAFDAPASLALYRALLAPLGEPAAEARHLIVAAAGALGQLPMAVLVTGEPAADGATPWLLRRVALSHVASASAWVTLRQVPARRSAGEAFAAWGDPAFDRNATAAEPRAPRGARQLVPRSGFDYGRIPALPDTRDEVVAIADTLQASRERDLFLGDKATRASVLQANGSGWLARKRVIAFATHGLVPGDLPELTQPALALADDGSAAGNPLAPLLTLDDVLTLKLQADWVVLSACNTASADGSSQEALSGLARGFFYAGTRSLLVTHWAVDSEAATQLTTRTFAHQRAQPGVRKAESLRLAELDLMARPGWAHPAFWAPYALVGDGGP